MTAPSRLRAPGRSTSVALKVRRCARPGVQLRAFTLLELLVVIGVIAVLAALLAGGLSQAKSAAHRVECLSRQKQWSLAFLQFTSDHEERIPREGFHTNGQVFLNNWAQVQDPRGADAWYNALAEYVAVLPAAHYAPPVNTLSFYERSSLFHCPSARLPRVARSAFYRTALFSIAMNSQLIEYPNAPTISFASVKDPSSTALFLDNLLDEETRLMPEQAWDNLGQPSATANRFAGRRHGRGGIIAFADGSARWLPAGDVVECNGPNRGWIIFPQREVIWMPDDN